MVWLYGSAIHRERGTFPYLSKRGKGEAIFFLSLVWGAHMNMKLKQEKHTMLDERLFLFSYRPCASIFWVSQTWAAIFFFIFVIKFWKEKRLFCLFNSLDSIPWNKFSEGQPVLCILFSDWQPSAGWQPWVWTFGLNLGWSNCFFINLGIFISRIADPDPDPDPDPQDPYVFGLLDSDPDSSIIKQK